jgi:protein gp37
MADHTKIEWTDATWNPITGCTHCYAARLAATRLKDHPSRKGLARLNAAGAAKFTGEVRFNEQWLAQPLHWKKPRRIFVCAHGDLFHESVYAEWIDKVFAVMALAHWHTFQVLTKRANLARNYCSAVTTPQHVWKTASKMRDTIDALAFNRAEWGGNTPWPLANVWLGTSVENQARADERIPDLLATPAATRFVSAEPLLGPVDLNKLWRTNNELWHGRSGKIWCAGAGSIDSETFQCPKIDWVIVGGESGPNARPMHPGWAMSIRDQCKAASIPFHFKQWGGARSKSGGRLLDGIEHNGFPEARHHG